MRSCCGPRCAVGMRYLFDRVQKSHGARLAVRGTFGRANGARPPRQLLPDHLRRNANKLLERLARTVEPFRMRQAAYNFLR